MKFALPDTSTKVASTIDNLPKDWQSAKPEITADDVIDAYFKGKEDGKKEKIEKIKSEFFVNLKLATSIAEELYETGNENNLKLEGIRLKARGLRSFDILFLVDDEMFVSDQFREAYVLSRAIKNKYKSEIVTYSFSFTPHTENLNEDCLTADGFFMKYGTGEEA